MVMNTLRNSLQGGQLPAAKKMDCTTTISNLGEILGTVCKDRRLNKGYSRRIIRTTSPLFFVFKKYGSFLL